MTATYKDMTEEKGITEEQKKKLGNLGYSDPFLRPYTSKIKY